jgi:pSer/pThr/pTyr-binding forkhead associated (FHA) protein
MASLSSFVQEAKKLSLDEFIAKYNHPFLIVHGQRDFESDEEQSKDTDLMSTDEAQASEIHIFPVKEQTDSSAFGFLTIGRSSKNHIVISSRMVSKIHVIIHKVQDRFSIVDAGSNNGTILNDQALSANISYMLNDRDTFILARKVVLQFLHSSTAYLWLQEKAKDLMLSQEG